MGSNLENNKLIPLDVLYIGESPHGNKSICKPVIDRLLLYPSVRSIGNTYELRVAKHIINTQNINTLIVDPSEVYPDSRSSLSGMHDVLKYILDLQLSHPDIVVVINCPSYSVDQIIDFDNRFKSFFIIGWPVHPLRRYTDFENHIVGSEKIDEIIYEVLDDCQKWHQQRYQYDIALSFAGEDRAFVETLLNELEKREIKVFYDMKFQSHLVGSDLIEELYKIYSTESRYCGMVISESYRDKVWTQFERRTAQERALRSRGYGYMIPIRIDNTPLPGFHNTVGYVRAEEGPERIANIIAEKLWIDPQAEKRFINIPPLP